MQFIRTLFQLKWYQLLFIFAVLTLMASSFLQLLTPEQVTQQTLILRNEDGSTTDFKTVTYRGPVLEVPSELAIGTASTAETAAISGEKLQSAMIAAFELTPNEEIAEAYTNPEYILTGLPDSQFTLIRTIDPPSGRISLETAVQVATDLVETIYPENPPTLVNSSIKYYSDEGLSHPEETSPSKANQIELTFSYAFDDYPLFIDQTVIRPVVIAVNAEGTVQKAVVTPSIISTAKSGFVSTIEISQALQNIQNDRASIIAQSYDGHGSALLTSIEVADFTDAYIEYRVDDAEKSVYPYYHFVGQLTNTAGEVFTGHVITPAVQTDFSQR